MVCASDGEFGRGGTLGAILAEDGPPWDKLSGGGGRGWPAVDGLGLF